MQQLVAAHAPRRRRVPGPLLPVGAVLPRPETAGSGRWCVPYLHARPQKAPNKIDFLWNFA
jgi:hypothetical protein